MHLEVRKVGLLIELCLLKTERVGNIVDGDRAILNTFILLFRRRVGTFGIC